MKSWTGAKSTEIGSSGISVSAFVGSLDSGQECQRKTSLSSRPYWKDLNLYPCADSIKYSMAAIGRGAVLALLL